MFVLAEGGMGTVEAALDLGPTASSEGAESPEPNVERIVALKRLLPGAARDKRRIEMFLREARLAKMLEHPNIVRAYDFGELGGELYLAMEFVDGEPLSKLLTAIKESGETLPLEITAWLLAEVCRGLHAAHELCDPATGAALHLVHRDVSPHNIMLGFDGRVRLLDFGVAKIDSGNATRTGEVKGKAAYMSPEQAMGDPLERRSDLFSLGAVLYECVTLERMWGNGTDMDVIRKLALESPPRLQMTELSAPPSLVVPEALASLHATLVEKEASARPRAALEVAEALDAFVPDPAGAARRLGALLSRYFGAAAQVRREKLTRALETLTPTQAATLRESVLPGVPETPPAGRAPRRAGRTFALGALGITVALFFIAARMRPTERREPLPAPSSALTPVVMQAAPAHSAAQVPTAPALSDAAAEPAASASARRPLALPRRAPKAQPSAKPKAADIDETPF